MGEQLIITDDAIAARDEGMARAIAPLSEQALRDADRIIRHWASLGLPFTADDAREQLDLAQVPLSSRGTIFRNAVRAGVLKKVHYRPSAHTSAHGKPVLVYVGALQHEEAR